MVILEMVCPKIIYSPGSAKTNSDASSVGLVFRVI